LLMHEAAICKQGNRRARRHDGMHLLEDWLVIFKTNLGTSMTQCSPRERNGTTTIDEGSADQDKGWKPRQDILARFLLLVSSYIVKVVVSNV
jgi:hypothetical protein